MKKAILGVFAIGAMITIGMTADVFAAEIGNTVWNDRNKNHVQDAGEEGISGVRVKLYHGDEVDTDKTNSRGRYHFTDLDAGSYTITVAQETLPVGCYATYDRDGNKNGTYSDKYLQEDDSFTHADFGYYCPTEQQTVTRRISPATGAGDMAVVIALAIAAVAGSIVYFRLSRKA